MDFMKEHVGFWSQWVPDRGYGFYVRTIVLLYLLYLLNRAVYRITTHPLAHFPGPRTAAASQIPRVYHLLRGSTSRWILSLHTTYRSDVVRISPHELSFISAAAWDDIYPRKPGRPTYDKSVGGFGSALGRIPPMLTAPAADHARMRRVFNPAFGAKAMQEILPRVESCVQRLFDGLRREAQPAEDGARSPQDLGRWYSWLSFDLVGLNTFSQDFGCMQGSSFQAWMDALAPFVQGAAFIGAAERFPVFAVLLLPLLPYLLPRRAREAWRTHDRFFARTFAKRLASDPAKRDFLTAAIERSETGTMLSPPEVKQNAELFVFAGAESTASTLSGVTFHLLANPEVRKKLVTELDAAFAKDEDITIEAVAKLPYLNAVLTESHRRYPFSHAGTPAVVPPGGDMISGHWVPGQTTVIVNNYAAGRSPANFKDPDAFVPERWLDDARYAGDARGAVRPFSLGPRGCIGKALGEATTRLALAKLVWNFDMNFAGEADRAWDAQQRHFLSPERGPLMVALAPRGRQAGAHGGPKVTVLSGPIRYVGTTG